MPSEPNRHPRHPLHVSPKTFRLLTQLRQSLTTPPGHPPTYDDVIGWLLGVAREHGPEIRARVANDKIIRGLIERRRR